MTGPKRQAVIVATNPLHYTYFCRQYPEIPVVGSQKGMIADYASSLGMSDDLTLFNCANNIEELTKEAQQKFTNTSPLFLTWKPLILETSINYQLEQKTYLRDLLPAGTFPEFRVVKPAELNHIEIEKLKDELNSPNLVVQVDFSTGGKGTFFVASQQDFEAILPQLAATGQEVVVSRYVKGTSRALQCFMDDAIMYPSWWHRDLVGINGICSQVDGATKYCGAILENIPPEHIDQLQVIVERVQPILKKHDYYGVFGLDIVQEDATGKLYLIEMNPRFTAVSHVYATAMRAVGYKGDFMTAHTAGLIYGRHVNQVFTDDFKSKQLTLPHQYYYLKLQNLADKKAALNESSRLGLYDSGLDYKKFGFGVEVLQDDEDIVVIPESAQGISRTPGERVYSVIGIGSPVDKDNKLQAVLRTKLDKLSAKLLDT